MQVTTFVPMAKVLPLAGTQTTEGDASQASEAEEVKVTTAPLELVHSAMTFVEQVATGAVISWTVRVAPALVTDPTPLATTTSNVPALARLRLLSVSRGPVAPTMATVFERH